MKYWKTLFSLPFFFGTLAAQHLEPTVLASNGGIDQAGGLQLEWTLGELATSGITGQDKSYTEGFHQPVLVVERVLSWITPNHAGFPEDQLTVRPNPVKTALTIHFNKIKSPLLTFQLRNINGSPLMERTVSTLEGDVIVDMSDLAPGLYYMQFRSADDGVMPVYKIVRIQ